MSRSALVIVVLGLAALVAGLTGYLVGSSGAATEDEARNAKEDAYDQAFEDAYADTRQTSAQAGIEAGRARGVKAGRRAGIERGDEVGSGEAGAELAAIEEASEPEVVCDGAVADDAHYAACLEQSGQAIPPGFPGGPAGCPTVPPYPVDGSCARP